MPIDTRRYYETPEGIALEMRLAGPLVRACAWAIDFAIRCALYLGLTLILAFLGGLGLAVALIGFFLIEWFYPVLFEVHSGMTPGKKAMGLWVIQDNGTPIDWSASLVRNLLRAADFLPLFYGFGLICMLINRDFKRLGDLAAGTLVVYRETQSQRLELPQAEPLPPPRPLTLEEQQTLLAFAERSHRLSAERREELAGLLAPWIRPGSVSPEQGLYAYARWLTKGR